MEIVAPASLLLHSLYVHVSRDMMQDVVSIWVNC